MKQKSRNSIRAILWLAVSCAIHIVLFRSRIDMNAPLPVRLLFVVLGIAFTLSLHEIIHFLFMNLVGLKNVRIESGRDPLGIPSLRTVAQEEVHGRKRILILLAPFVLLTLVPDILFFISGQVHLLFFIMALSNSAGCYFDLSDTIREIVANRKEGT